MFTHPMDKQCNLRSTKRDSIEIPVQVLCGDSEFSSKIGGFANMEQSQVTYSEDSDSRSEFDWSGLVAESDNDTKNVTTEKLKSFYWRQPGVNFKYN